MAKNPEKTQDVVDTPAVPSEAPKSKKISVRAVFGGPMRNPLTEDLFTGEASKPVVRDEWINVQIEAGKLAVADE